MKSTFEFRDLHKKLALRPNVREDQFPTLSVAIEYELHSPEPDVGIFGAQLEVREATYYLDMTPYASEDSFSAAVWARIRDLVYDSPRAVTLLLITQVRTWADELEADADYDPEE